MNTLSIILFLFLWLLAEPANAVQTHGGAEGLVSHQLGHILFVTGLLFLLTQLPSRKTSSPGWAEFKWFLFLLILWNCLTFYGHWRWEYIESARFLREDGFISAMRVTNVRDAFFYLSRLDHLLLVPAFVCLAMALHKWTSRP